MSDVQSLLDLATGKMSRRTFVSQSLALGAAFSSAGALAACGSQSSGTSTGTAAKSLIFNYDQGDTNLRRIITLLVNDFQKKTGIKVTANPLSFNDYMSAIRSYFSSDSPPDVLSYSAGERTRFFIERGVLLDISDLWEKNKWQAAFPDAFHTLSQGADGKYYFLPTAWYWWSVFYRKSTFTKYNLTPPTSFSDFFRVCDTFKSQGVAPIAIGAIDTWALAGWFDFLNMRMNGPEIHIALTGGKAHYTDDKVKKVFALWRDMIKKGYFTSGASAYTWQEPVAPLVKGQAGMYLMGRFIMDEVPADAKADVDFFQFPVDDANTPIGIEAPTDGYFIPKKAKHADAGKQFLTYLGSSDAQTLYVKSGAGGLATNLDVPASSYDNFNQRGIALVKQAKFVTQFYDRDTDSTVAARGVAFFSQFFNNPDLDLQAGLSNLDGFAQTIYKQQQ